MFSTCVSAAAGDMSNAPYSEPATVDIGLYSLKQRVDFVGISFQAQFPGYLRVRVWLRYFFVFRFYFRGLC